jgi:hypothetical protein
MDERFARPVKHVFDCQVALLNDQRGGNQQNSIYDGMKNILVKTVVHGASSNLFGTLSLFELPP